MVISRAYRLPVLLLAVGLSAAGAACDKLNPGLSPSSVAGLPAGSSSLLGTWTSSGTTPGNACKDFAWTITSQTATSAAGTISATCLGSIALQATVTAQLAGSTIQFTAVGSGTLPGPTVCDFSISGTATIESDTIRIPYSGTTCLGPVTGTEVLKKNAPAPAVASLSSRIG